ncbi:MAG: NAD(P)-binding protein [Hyphomicrobiaceae bacterium]|nr:NAD(P)-binding protein [Hyphomicrobiaceae bacterium]
MPHAKSGTEIARRDFLNGAALTIAAGLAPIDQLAAAPPTLPTTSVYPPALDGLRGTTDAAFKVMHSIVFEGKRFDVDGAATEESYDLVVVGAGLAGLTAAWSFRERRPNARVLILDNNDDFGGHARRTEHKAGKRLLLSYGGSESMVAPSVKFSGELARILKELRIEPTRFEDESVFHRKLYPGLKLSKATFFDRETFGREKLVTGDPLMLGFDEFAPDNPGARPIAAFLADCPLSDIARAGLAELFEGSRDYLGNMTPEAKLERLEKVSYRQFLTEICKLPEDAANFFQGRSCDSWGFGIDALGAIEMMGDGYPGAKALRIEDKAAGHAEDKAAYVHHFPDGNASIARALVRDMIRGSVKGVLTGRSMESLVTAEMDYGRLDRAGQPVRLRLESTVVSVRNTAADGVDIAYVKDGKLSRVHARHAVIATYAGVIPRICPEYSKEAADLARQNVKAPLVYTKVVVRNWESFVRLGVHKISAPTSFHTLVKLDYPVSLGRYNFPKSPKEPMVLHLVHVPGEPLQGLGMREQARAGRTRLLGMPFADMETAIRQDLDRMLSPGGFDAGRDILGITVNRWSHGYSYTPTGLYDDVEAMQNSQDVMRAKIGNIAFANSDTAWDAYAHSAMSEAVRAVGDLTGDPPPSPKPRWYQRFLARLSGGSSSPPGGSATPAGK